MVPSREIYWNIPAHQLLYLVFLPFALIFLYGCYRIYHQLAIGKPEERLDPLKERLKVFWDGVALQRRLLIEPSPGVMHLFLSWGFVVLFIATTLVAFQDYFGIPTLSGKFYLYFMSLAVDLFGVLAVVGTGMALFRRYVLRPKRLSEPRGMDRFGLLLWLFLGILLTGFLVEGLRIVGTRDPWGIWSPGGYIATLPFHALDFSEVILLHRLLWWFHAVLAFAFIAVIPYLPILHVLTAPVNVFFRTLGPSGVLQPIEVEKVEKLGASQVKDFSWKQLLDLYACTECGRCQAACPAWATGKPLTPKGVILDLRDHLVKGDGRKMIGEVISEEAIWACTTCGACHEACPVFIEPIPKIVGMRRHLVMEEARFPPSMQDGLSSLEVRGHPYRGTTVGRTDWAKGLAVKELSKDGPVPLLYWVGCAAAFDERNQKVARAMAKLLQQAGIDFGILGGEEKCTGDPARRIGNEYLFQILARENIETLNRYKVQRILTTCPHCFHTLKNEYPQFGGRYEVIHHTEFIGQLLEEGTLRPEQPLAALAAFHDPCYLGRHNGIYEKPRALLKAIPEVRVKELPRCREKSFCCGAGGGLMWVEERIGKRINLERTEEVLEAGVGVVGTACPFCLTMFEDGLAVTGKKESVKARDVAELLADSL
ncbi:MAG: (Fe-S)-binding protein [candidate division NC10 bacterium]|nr:(Fe-S)-binding protein [candidate division NC10 bacterium]